jgi:hypothetical protein
MTIETNQRGFQFGKFIDRNGEECSIQLSSLATEEAIWLGIDKPKLCVFENDSHGKYLITEMPKNFDVSSRMHLTRNDVIELVSVLNNFLKYGTLQLP